MQGLQAQEAAITLSLEDVLRLTRERSYKVFIAKNTYLIKTLDYETIKKMLHPKMHFSLTPGNYERSISELWDSDEGLFRPYEVKRLISESIISINKGFGSTGGILSLSSSLNRSITYYDNQNNYKSYISSPISINYSQDFNSINAYKWKSELGELEYLEASKQYIEDLESANIESIRLYFEFMDAELLMEISERNRNYCDTLLLIGQRRAQLSAISNSDYLKLQLNKINAEMAYESAIQQRNQTLIALNHYLELPLETQIVCQQAGPIPQININAAEAVSIALTNNPDMVSLERKLVEAKKAIKEANANRLTANFNINIGLNQNQDRFSAVYKNLLDRQGVSLTLSMPIIDWGDAKRARSRAQINKEMIEEGNRKIRQDLKLEVLKIVQEHLLQKKQVEALALADSIALLANEAVQKQNLLGKSSVIELNESYREMLSAHNNYLSSLLGFWISYYSIRKLCLYDFERNSDLLIEE